MNGIGSYDNGKKKDKLYKVEVAYLYREVEVVQVGAKCSGEAERLAIEVVEHQFGGSEHEINRIERIED